MRVIVTLILIVCAIGAYRDLVWKKQTLVQSANLSLSKTSSAPKKRYYNDIILISRDEAEFLSQQVQNKFENQDFTPIRLKDGTQIPIQFTPNGRICPRTGLPEGNVSLTAKIALSN